MRMSREAAAQQRSLIISGDSEAVRLAWRWREAAFRRDSGLQAVDQPGTEAGTQVFAAATGGGGRLRGGGQQLAAMAISWLNRANRAIWPSASRQAFVAGDLVIECAWPWRR